MVKWYIAFKLMALVSLAVHVFLHIVSVTDFFNRIFIAFSLVVLLLPRKWWGLYIVPVIVLLAGLIVGGYVVYLWAAT